jgi:hypothetical protein
MRDLIVTENITVDGVIDASEVSKYVFSRTLYDPGWAGTTVLRGPLREEIEQLKSDPGVDIVTTGSMTLVSDLIQPCRRVPAVRASGGARTRPAPVPGRRIDRQAGARGEQALSLRDRADALPDDVSRVCAVDASVVTYDRAPGRRVRED